MRLNQLEKLAERLATEAIEGRRDVAGVLLIGSVALARPSADSDIDLAILLSGDKTQTPAYECVDGVWIGYEFFNLPALRRLGKAPMLNQEDLRNAARLAMGRILVQKDRDLPCVLARLREARPLVSETRRLFTTIDKTEVIARAMAGRPQARALQGMTFALSILALNLTPYRFQKPKWVLQDLKASANPALLELIDQLFPPWEHGGITARGICDAVSGATLRLFNMLGFPNLGYTGSDHDLDYVYRTLLDAESLLGAGQWKEAAFVATWAVRLGRTLAKRRSALGDIMAESGDADVPDMAPQQAVRALQKISSEARRLFLAYSSLYGDRPNP